MNKSLSLYRLFVHRNMLALIIISILFLFTTGIATGNMMPCETYIDSTYNSSDAYVKMNYLCNDPMFHKFIINIRFTFNMILLSLFIATSTCYFFLIFKRNFKHIPKEFSDVGFSQNLSLLSSLPIKETTILKCTISYSFALIIVPLTILQLPTLIKFVRTFNWTGIDLNTFTITIIMLSLLMSIIIFKLLHSPKLNITLNMFVHLFLLIAMILLPFLLDKISKYVFLNFSNFTNVVYVFNSNNPIFLIGAIILFVVLAILLKNRFIKNMSLI